MRLHPRHCRHVKSQTPHSNVGKLKFPYWTKVPERYPVLPHGIIYVGYLYIKNIIYILVPRDLHTC